MGRSMRAKNPYEVSNASIFPCGIATPSPTPVVPNFSRSNKTSKIC